jgi:hypothetical protein
MPTIFIDANIFLDSYRRADKSYRTLLRSLKALSPHLLLTKTVLSEIERNRVSVYMDANKIEKKSINLAMAEMHSHYSEDTTDVDETYRELRSLDQSVKRDQAALFERVEQIHNKNLLAIIKGDDDVTATIRELAKVVKEETPQEIERARIRKERGQSPGKKNDPLGDQISWEQLLVHAVDTGSVWIVSRDGDYTIQVDDDVYLQPSLFREISSVKGVSSVHCFRSLSAFFEAFSKVGIASTAALPNEADIVKAEENTDSLWDNSEIPIDLKIMDAWRKVQKSLVRMLNLEKRQRETRPLALVIENELRNLRDPTAKRIHTYFNQIRRIRNVAAHDPEQLSSMSKEDLERIRDIANELVSFAESRKLGS